MVKVIDFETKRREREQNKRYEYIQSKIQLGQPKLFDELIAEQELSDEKTASCNDFLIKIRESGRDPLAVVQEASFMFGSEEDYYEDHGVEWHIAIEESLIYYAVLRKHDKDSYDLALLLHPYVGTVD